MSWVTVDQEKCTACGLCVLRCVRCFSDNDGEITANAKIYAVIVWRFVR
jgi:ferredoxin